jgi:hypothetical protein
MTVDGVDVLEDHVSGAGHLLSDRRWERDPLRSRTFASDEMQKRRPRHILERSRRRRPLHSAVEILRGSDCRRLHSWPFQPQATSRCAAQWNVVAMTAGAGEGTTLHETRPVSIAPANLFLSANKGTSEHNAVGSESDLQATLQNVERLHMEQQAALDQLRVQIALDNTS